MKPVWKFLLQAIWRVRARRAPICLFFFSLQRVFDLLQGSLWPRSTVRLGLNEGQDLQVHSVGSAAPALRFLIYDMSGLRISTQPSKLVCEARQKRNKQCGRAFTTLQKRQRVNNNSYLHSATRSANGANFFQCMIPCSTTFLEFSYRPAVAGQPCGMLAFWAAVHEGFL